MSTFNSAAALAASQKRRFGAVERSFRSEHRKGAEVMADRMRDLVSGTISTKELARRGHPFGRGKGRIPLTLKEGGKNRRYRTFKPPPRITPTPLLPINKQTGRLLRSLRIIPEHYGGKQSFRVQFTAPHAGKVLRKGGTEKMVDRGYWAEVRKIGRSIQSKTTYQMRLRQLQIMYGQA